MEPAWVAISTLCMPGNVNVALPEVAVVIGPTEIKARLVAPPFAVEIVGLPTSWRA